MGLAQQLGLFIYWAVAFLINNIKIYFDYLGPSCQVLTVGALLSGSYSWGSVVSYLPVFTSQILILHIPTANNQ